MEQLKDLSHLDWVQTWLNVFVICSLLIAVFGLFAYGVIKYLTRPGYREIDEDLSRKDALLGCEGACHRCEDRKCEARTNYRKVLIH